MDKRYTKAEILEKKEDSFVAVASTPKEDRHGEVVSAEGWDLKTFKKQPRILWAHDHTIPAIGKATKIWVDGKGKSAKLMFEMVFQEVTDLAKGLKQLAEDGIIDTFSVGFLPIEMDGNTYTKQELLEISLVNVPANSDAMLRAYKSLQKSGFTKDVISDIGIPVAVLDKLEAYDKKIDELSRKVETVVKAPNAVNPPVRSTRLIRDRQSMLKVIARASDKLLEGEKKTSLPKADRTKLLKVIKASSDNLLADQKEQLIINGKDSGAA